MESISIPRGVTFIGDSAFARCEKLENIVFPSALTSIGQSAFAYCSALTSLTIPSSITDIDERAFESCTKLTIYAEANEEPRGWVDGWNDSNRTVVWGCVLSEDKTYVASFEKTDNNISNHNAKGGINAPYREGYTFEGWAREPEGELDCVANIIYFIENGTMYSVWTENPA